MADDTTKLSDFLDSATPAPLPSTARPLPNTLQDQPTAGTTSMGTFLDAVGADLSVPPEAEDKEDPLFDPHAAGPAPADPGDHRAFLSSMGVPVTPAPVQRRTSGFAQRATAAVQRNWVPALLMAIAIAVLTFYIVGIFRF